VVGGQIHGEPQRLFHIYRACNFIEVTPETLALNRRSQYGKSDRLRDQSQHHFDAAKCVLVSFDSTMQQYFVGCRSTCRVLTQQPAPGIALHRRPIPTNMIHNSGRGAQRVFAQIRTRNGMRPDARREPQEIRT
jgi:hypothetical protein